MAVNWGDQEPVPLLNQPLGAQERLCVAGLASALAVHWAGGVHAVAQASSTACLSCGVIVISHASFRARSLSSRWHRFAKDATEKVD